MIFGGDLPPAHLAVMEPRHHGPTPYSQPLAALKISEGITRPHLLDGDLGRKGQGREVREVLVFHKSLQGGHTPYRLL